MVATTTPNVAPLASPNTKPTLDQVTIAYMRRESRFSVPLSMGTSYSALGSEANT